jgi:hypothetical protein
VTGSSSSGGHVDAGKIEPHYGHYFFTVADEMNAFRNRLGSPDGFGNFERKGALDGMQREREQLERRIQQIDENFGSPRGR